MAEDEIERPIAEEAKGKGIMSLVATLAVVTLLGGAAGALITGWQVDKASAVATQRAHAEPIKKEDALAWNENTAIARLEPVITNLAAPSNTWIRLDTAMVFDRDAVGDVERMKAEVAESVVAFLRTLSLQEIEGASAFNHLRDDLNDRARNVSSGTVEQIVIETMVLQ